MATILNADEAFEMAERMESNAATFYRSAAELHDERQRPFLLRLATMEVEHKQIFSEMRQALTEREKEPVAFDPDSESSLYLNPMVDARGVEGSPAIAASLTGKETREEILAIAIGLEKQSVLFYVGLRDMVSPQGGRSRIDAIIAQEKSHIVILSRERRTVMGV